MADFDVIVSGVTVQDWLDPPSTGVAPSRLNSEQRFPQKRFVGSVGTSVVLQCVVGGVVAPLDGALGGRLFFGWAVEAPSMPFTAIQGDFGQSSIQRVQPDKPGHYTIGIRRHDGGLVHIPLDIG